MYDKLQDIEDSTKALKQLLNIRSDTDTKPAGGKQSSREGISTGTSTLSVYTTGGGNSKTDKESATCVASRDMNKITDMPAADSSNTDGKYWSSPVSVEDLFKSKNFMIRIKTELLRWPNSNSVLCNYRLLQ